MIFKNQNSPRNETFHIYIYILEFEICITIFLWNLSYQSSTLQVHCSEQVDSTKWILLNELFLS